MWPGASRTDGSARHNRFLPEGWGGGARVSLQGVRGRGGPGDSGCAGGGPVPHETPRGGGRGQPRLPNGQQELGGDRVQGWTPTVWGSRRAGFKSAPQKAV